MERQEYETEPLNVASEVKVTAAEGWPETTVGGPDGAELIMVSAFDVLVVKLESPL
jgi:hypothetical protein